jgi:hypothetical protein
MPRRRLCLKLRLRRLHRPPVVCSMALFDGPTVSLPNAKLKAIDVIHVLSDLFILRNVPGHIRSDNGPEFVA